MDDKIKQVEKALGEPIAIDFSDYVRKIRNNLIILSLISIGISLGNLTLSPDSSFLGLKFNGLNNQHIVTALFYLNIYFLIHFMWCSIDHILEWRIRVTGTKVAFITAATFASEDGDYPKDPRQTSLYNWWVSQARKIASLTEPLDAISAKLAEWEQKVNHALRKNDHNITNEVMAINKIAEEITKLKSSLESVDKTIKSNRIPTSLKRFDNWFLLFLRSQDLRWLVIELMLPIIVAMFSVLLLWQKL